MMRLLTVMATRFTMGIIALLVAAPLYAADPAPFELAGPSLRIQVQRGEQSLPIVQVPSLSEGDRISVEADLPEDQGARFVLVSAFLRGATNPPPKDWITFAETWKKKKKALTLTVPKGARQMVLFLVPDTGGVEGAMIDAVRGKPGEFVRATQDLNQASLDRSRLDAFMGAIRAQENTHPEYLRSVAPKLARSLSMKLNEDCLSKVIEMQATCLLENRDTLVLADVHSSSMAETLSGAPTDLALQLSATREAGYGFYSPYIGVVRDIAKIFGAFSNPEFDYLPTLNIRKGDDIGLLLNSAPSFKKPKSVMVIAMPAIEADSPPRLRAGAGDPVCAIRPDAVVPVEGAPLLYSTAYARAMQLTLTAASGETVELPATARADRGGYAISGNGLPKAFQGTVRGHLHGQWGFNRFEGPDFMLQLPDDKAWVPEGDAPTLVVGRDNDLSLKGGAPACVESVTLRQEGGSTKALGWKLSGTDGLSLTLPLADSKPGMISVDVKYYGVARPTTLSLRSYTQASRLDGLSIHAGDRVASLSGQRLDQVESVGIGSISFRPDGLVRDGTVDRLTLRMQDDSKAPELGSSATARVKLRDGRAVSVPVTITAPRPQVTLLSKSITPGPPPANTQPLTLDGDALMPDNGRLIFSIRANGNTRLAADDVIEIGSADDDGIIRLTTANGLQLEGAQVMVATLDAKAMAPGMFGPLRFRLRHGNDLSDWQSLISLVRLPQIETISCDVQADGCVIKGRDLFLIDAIGTSPTFDQSTQVANGYTGSIIRVTKPQLGKFYLRLRDAADGVAVLPLSTDP